MLFPRPSFAGPAPPVRRMGGRAGALRPYRMHALLLVYTPLLLFADGRMGRKEPQIVLGILTFALLWACTRTVAAEHRRQAWLCVPVATVFEIFGSLIWGGYHYQLDNIPLYVPPGHGLVYLFGVTAAGLPVARRHGPRIAHAVLAVATAWTVAGLTVLPLLGSRLDLSGALLWPLFAWCILRSGRPMLFAAIWVATATLEIAGVLAGAWTWVAVAPWSHLASGNPPSAIAAGYAIIDGSVALLAVVLARAASVYLPRDRDRGPGEADDSLTASASRVG